MGVTEGVPDCVNVPDNVPDFEEVAVIDGVPDGVPERDAVPEVVTDIVAVGVVDSDEPGDGVGVCVDVGV